MFCDECILLELGSNCFCPYTILQQTALSYANVEEKKTKRKPEQGSPTNEGDLLGTWPHSGR